MLRTDALPARTLAALSKIMQVDVLSDRILVGGTGLTLYKAHCPEVPNWNPLMVLKSLTYFDNAIQTDQPVTLGRKVGWEIVKKTTNKAVDAYGL